MRTLLLIGYALALAFAPSDSEDALTKEGNPCTREKLIWSPDVRLGIGDFEGPLGNPEHSAEANTGIATSSRAGDNPSTFLVEAQTFFDPCKSWFRRDAPDTDNTLAHERIHFDITEVYARRLMARYKNEIGGHREFLRKHKQVYEEVWRASRGTQDRYDEEVYADPNRQAYWARWVHAQLADTQAYADKVIELPMSR